MATLGRKNEVEEFIISLNNQTYKNYELIIIDQNKEDFIKKIYEKYKEEIDIKYIKSDIKGLSKCRNIGLKHVTGDIVAFPDDDCEYPEELLSNVIERLKSKEMDILTFKSIDKVKRIDSNNVWEKEDQIVNIVNLERTAISYTIFIKYKYLFDIKFDEKLGVGEYFGSAEETDMLSNLMNKGYVVKYMANIYAYHPIKQEVKERYYKYALGMGAYIKKEILIRSKSKYIKRALELILIRPVGGIVMSFIKLDVKNIKKYSYVFWGRLRGFIEYKI